jgi:hypothetical protein
MEQLIRGTIMQENSPSEAPQADTSLYEQRFNLLTDGFGEKCELENVNTAIAIAIHPLEERPIVFARGHKYDIAKLLALLLKGLRAEMMEELDSLPGSDYSRGD